MCFSGIKGRIKGGKKSPRLARGTAANEKGPSESLQESRVLWLFATMTSPPLAFSVQDPAPSHLFADDFTCDSQQIIIYIKNRLKKAPRCPKKKTRRFSRLTVFYFSLKNCSSSVLSQTRSVLPTEPFRSNID